MKIEHLALLGIGAWLLLSKRTVAQDTLIYPSATKAAETGVYYPTTSASQIVTPVTSYTPISSTIYPVYPSISGVGSISADAASIMSPAEIQRYLSDIGLG